MRATVTCARCNRSVLRCRAVTIAGKQYGGRCSTYIPRPAATPAWDAAAFREQMRAIDPELTAQLEQIAPNAVAVHYLLNITPSRGNWTATDVLAEGRRTLIRLAS